MRKKWEKNGKIGLIFYALTPYHVFTSAYYSMQVCWKSNVKKYLIWFEKSNCKLDLSFVEEYFDEIIVLRDWQEQKIIKRIYNRLLNCGFLFRFSNIGKILSVHHKYIFVCFNDQCEFVVKPIAELKKKKKNVICFIDEGEGAYYLPSDHYKIPIYKRMIKNILGIKPVGKYYGHTKNIDAWIVRHPMLLPREKSKIAKVIQQNDIFKDFNWVQKFDFLWKNTEDILSYDKRKILWIGTPLIENGIQEKEELVKVRKIFDILYNDYRIYIKLHPREQKEKFDELINQYNIIKINPDLSWIPLELFINKINPDIIITATSSAAFHIYEMGYKGKVIYTYGYIKKNDDDSSILKSHAKNDNVYYINTIDELKNVIYKVKIKQRKQLQQNENADIQYFEEIQKE